MPKAIKKRVAKRSGLKEEEVKSAAARALEIIKSKKNVLLPVLLACAVIIVLLVISLVYSGSAKNRAYALEKEAYKYYYGLGPGSPLSGADRWGKPLELFKQAVETRSTPTALFYMGNCYFNLGDYGNATKTYDKFIDKYKSKEGILPLVYQKLASSHIKKGENDEAIKTLDALAGFRNGTFRDTALIQEARLYESLDRQEEAMTKYRELVESFPASPWSAEAKTKIDAVEKKAAAETGEQETLVPDDRLQPPPSD